MPDIDLPYKKHLLALVAAGDEQAFMDLFTPYLHSLEMGVKRLVHNQCYVQDILQETLLKCWLNRNKLLNVTDLRAYVYTIAVNEFHQFLRKEASEFKRRKFASKKLYPVVTESNMHLLEVEQALSNAVRDLTPQRQKIYRLSREEGRTIPEISKELNLSSSTVKHTLIAALHGIRQYLEKAGFTSLF